eukprot:1600572-Alexandrium_andersonii.AAC.1
MVLGRLSGGRIRLCALAGPATSAGPDGWISAIWPMPAELRHLPAIAFDLLAALYNTVEDGAAWPREVLKARAVALPKTTE